MPSSGTISQIQLPNGNIYDLASGGGAKNVWYGDCTTPSSTLAKVVTTTSGDFSLVTGNMIKIRMAEACPDNQSITLTVDNCNPTQLVVAHTSSYFGNGKMWGEGSVIDVVYDGARFIMVYGVPATTSNYGMTILSSSTSDSSSSKAATSGAVKTAYDLANSKSNVQIIRW